MSSLGAVPSRPIGPVTKGRSSGSTSRPSRALATPAPSSSATSATSSRAPAAPWPMRMATLAPSLRMSAARASSASSGRTRGLLQPTLENTAPCSFGGDGCASSSCTSSGMMIVETPRRVSAVLNARSMTCRAWAGAMTTSQNSDTSANRWSRSISCWKLAPREIRFCWPTIATTGWWSSLASYSPFSRCTAPGPEVAVQQPTSPVNLAWAQAMNAAISSCRGWMNSGSPPARSYAPRNPLIPSPG